MSETDNSTQGQKPKICWMAIASPLVVVVGLLVGIVFRFFLEGIPWTKTIAVGVLLLSMGVGLGLGVLAIFRTFKSQRRLGGVTGGLWAVLGVGMAVLLFIEVFLPIPHRRQEAIWAEGKAILGSISTGIRAYAAEQGADGQLPEDNDFDVLGFIAGDLDGTYFNQSTDKMFSFTVVSLNPLEFTVTAVNKNLKPNIVTLDQDGMWTEKTE
jgi:F0F1-type ATP synthase assembly protein I